MDHDVWSLAYKTVLEFKSNCVFLWEAHAVTTLLCPECGSEPRRAPLTKSIISACGWQSVCRVNRDVCSSRQVGAYVCPLGVEKGKHACYSSKDFRNKLILLFSKDALNWWKVTAGAFICYKWCLVQANVFLFELFIHQRILKKYHTNLTQLLSRTTVFNIDNNNKTCFWAANQHIKMISEGLWRLE